MSDHPDDHDAHDDLGHPPTAADLAAFARPEYRDDGPDKVTGRTQYVGDRVMPGMLFAAHLESQVPHGLIRSVDTTAAKQIPGVRAVLTGADIEPIRFGRRLQDRPVLVADRVRFIGDRIAAVAADTLEIAEAAVAAIEVEIDELPPILDVQAAIQPDAEILHPDAETYAYIGGTRPAVSHPNVQGKLVRCRGAEDIETVFAGAERVFEHVFTTPRQHHGYIEPHAALVWIDEAEVVHVATTNKSPFALRGQMSKALGIPPARIDIQVGAIGGDFGGKGYSIDEYSCYLLARATGRPVKSVSRYADELAAMNVRHASRIRLRTAVDADGRLLAHEADVLLDGGAYASAKVLPHLVVSGGVGTLSAYRIPHVKIVARTIYTNTVPAGHMRAPGEVQALFAGESHLDAIARELGEDPFAFRLKNVVRDGEIGAAGEVYREVRGAEMLENLRTAIDWGRPRPAGRGVGIALGARHISGGAIGLRLHLHHDGRIELITGLVDQGGGQTTMLRRVFAQAASVDISRVSVTRLTTAAAPVDPGVGGSRVTHIASRVAVRLAEELRAWIDERLPRALPDAAPGVKLRDDGIVEPETGSVLLGFDELAARLVEPDSPVELSAEFAAVAHGPDDPGDFNFAAVGVEVEVDPETGVVSILDAVIVADVGTIFNPIAHAGQIDGGFAFGVGAALMEELIVEGGNVVGRSLGEVRLPTIRDVPVLRQVLMPTTIGPGAYGSKMAGELSNVPVAPAIANAVADALSDLDVTVNALPLSPDRVRTLIRNATLERSRT
ncbi:MAG: xanthine dehydrogenase family protein molybdopterin-binding subunit [Candidatus Limnocylindrales bacterium]|nr:xanthine dehydrogenase family protein molybdopterin-binding subunit [Candidatus Limnocylindrales bacterium]